MKTLNFGVEIEVNGLTVGQAIAVVHSAVGGRITETSVIAADGRIWRVVRDASLSGGSQSAEVVTPVLTYNDMDTLKKVVAALGKAGARVDKTCGIHVHVDGRKFNGPAMARLVKIIYRQEKQIEKALRIQRNRLDTYCKAIPADFAARVAAMRSPSLDDINIAWFGQRVLQPIHYDSTRYRGLNLQSFWYRGTIEFRWFEGSLNPAAVVAYVHFVLALSAKALNGKRAVVGRRTYSEASARYDFRVFLLGLGMIGPEFEKTREILALHLPGDAAWKSKEQRVR